MAMKVKVGDRFRVLRNIGDPANAALLAGWVGEVDEIVPAEVSGAGSYEEDHAVLFFTEDPVTPHRRVSFTEQQLTGAWKQWEGEDELVHFEKVS